MDPVHNRRGFYIVTPFLGMAFFMIAFASSAFFLNEDVQQNRIADASASNQLIFVSQALGADAFNVLLQNKIQIELDNMVLGSGSLFSQIEAQVISVIKKDVGTIYSPAYEGQYGITCEHTEAIHAATYILPTEYGPPGDVKIIDVDGTTVLKPLVSRYGLVCKTYEPPGQVTISLASKEYFLDATNICRQSPTACRWA